MKFEQLHHKKMHQQMRVLRLGDHKPISIVTGPPISITQKAVVEGPKIVSKKK
jgi:hypothetical protein